MLEIHEILKATQGRLISGRQDTRIRGISIDSRTIKPGECFIAIKGDNFDGHDFVAEVVRKGAKTIVVQGTGFPSPALGAGRVQGTEKASVIAVKDTIRALGDLARFQREKFNIPVVAVTGSNGKTTTKEMLAWVLSRKFKVLKNEGTKNNQIGLPMTLLKLNANFEIAVLEIGTNHFGEVAYLTKIAHPTTALITNIGPAHLEFLRDLAGVFREKYTLIKNLRPPYLTLLNADDHWLKKEIRRASERPFTVSFGINSPADFSVSGIRRFKERIEFFVQDKYKFTLATLGYYNIYNALGTIALARIFGIEYKEIIARLSAFKFPAGRLNILTRRKVKFIDDTYNSNPLSLSQALEALNTFPVRGRRIMVMGDMLELGKGKEIFHAQAGRKIAQVCDAFLAVGRLSAVAAEAAKACGFDRQNIFRCRNSQEAQEILLGKISPRAGDIVLIKGSRAMKMEQVLKKI